MNAIKHIALFCGIVLLAIGVIPQPATANQENIVFLDIPEGDTSFIVDEAKSMAWWVTGECKRPLPLEKRKNNKKQTFTSIKASKNVNIGSRQIKLSQQFRFNLAPSQASVDVYSSVRGGWSSIAVEVNETCTQEQTCRARMELPEC